MGWKNRAQQVQEAAQQAARDLEAENATSGGSTTTSSEAAQPPQRWGSWISGGGTKLVEYDGDIAPPESIAEREVAGGGMYLIAAELAVKGAMTEEVVQTTGRPLQREF